MKRKHILLMLGIAVSAFIFGHYRSNPEYKRTATGDKAVLPQTAADKDRELLFSLLNEVHTNYNVGNNKMVEAFQETKIYKNSYGDVTQVSVSAKFYVAKEAFQQIHGDLEIIRVEKSAIKEILDLLLKASKARIDAIDLFLKGCYLKEQIGKIAAANLIAAFKGGSPQTLPEYHGEMENGEAMVTVADTYVADALRKIKTLFDKTSLKGAYDLEIASMLGYYIDTTDSNVDYYVERANDALSNENFYEAILYYTCALKIKPNQKNLLIGLIKSEIGIGGYESAKAKVKEALNFFPSEKELITLRDEIAKK